MSTVRDGIERTEWHPYHRVSPARIARLNAFRDELGCAAVRAAWKTIGVTSDSG